jgi:hypothetical protein
MQVIKETDQHKWTAQNVQEMVKDLQDNITSYAIKLLLPKTPTNDGSGGSGGSRTQNPQNQSNNNPDPTFTGNSRPYRTGRLIAEVTKILTDEQKYDGTNDSFDQKLVIFLDICKKIELPEDALLKAFPALLKRLAEDHYYNNQLNLRTFESIKENLRNFFEGPSYYRRNLNIWNSTTLVTVTAKGTDKTIYENV